MSSDIKPEFQIMPDSFQNGKDILGTAVCHGDHHAALSSYSVTALKHNVI